MKIQRIQSQNRAFTLMEMLLVLAIIAMLAGMGIFLTRNVLPDAEKVKVKGDISAMRGNLIRYKTNGGLFPTTEQGLRALVVRPSDGPQPSSWSQSMKQEALMDPWGNPYQYRYPGVRNPSEFDIWSIGIDKKDGTDDDIGNW